MTAHNSESQASITPAKALQMLKDGNQRFVSNLKVNRNLLQQVNETRDGQWPFAVILSCMDSRTSVELIFDQGLGDVFSIRVAGNVVNTDILGSIEYACKAAGSKLIVVLGHSGCGAIKGACDHVEMGSLTELLSKIAPAMYLEKETKDLSLRTSKNNEFVENVATINVKRSVKTIVDRSNIIEELIESGEVAIIGAKLHIDSGEVEFYDDTMITNQRSVREQMSYEDAE